VYTADERNRSFLLASYERNKHTKGERRKRRKKYSLYKDVVRKKERRKSNKERTK
jgi:hypothetical protein